MKNPVINIHEMSMEDLLTLDLSELNPEQLKLFIQRTSNTASSKTKVRAATKQTQAKSLSQAELDMIDKLL